MLWLMIRVGCGSGATSSRVDDSIGGQFEGEADGGRLHSLAPARLALWAAPTSESG
jgi:hypothetical protein